MAKNSVENRGEPQMYRDEEKISKIVRSLEYRAPFEILVFQILGVADNVEKVMEYSKAIGKFIDNPENIEIRNLIVDRRFKEAADMMVLEIQRQETEQKAA